MRQMIDRGWGYLSIYLVAIVLDKKNKLLVSSVVKAEKQRLSHRCNLCNPVQKKAHQT